MFTLSIIEYDDSSQRPEVYQLILLTQQISAVSGSFLSWFGNAGA